MSIHDQDSLLVDLVSRGDFNYLEPVDRAILAYADKLTQTPARITEEDVNQLRSHGLNDRGLHDICAITAYFAFVNRMADGLGVELEERFPED